MVADGRDEAGNYTIVYGHEGTYVFTCSGTLSVNNQTTLAEFTVDVVDCKYSNLHAYSIEALLLSIISSELCPHLWRRYYISLK